MHSNSSGVATDLENGLSLEEVRRRTIKHGYNEIPEKRESLTILFAKRFWGITPWMLEITMALTWLLGKRLEFYVVLGLLLFNAILGFIQEQRANSALELLRQKLSIGARCGGYLFRSGSSSALRCVQKRDDDSL